MVRKTDSRCLPPLERCKKCGYMAFHIADLTGKYCPKCGEK
jgi:ribosomal protein L37E